MDPCIRVAEAQRDIDKQDVCCVNALLTDSHNMIEMTAAILVICRQRAQQARKAPHQTDARPVARAPLLVTHRSGLSDDGSPVAL